MNRITGRMTAKPVQFAAGNGRITINGMDAFVLYAKKQEMNFIIGRKIVRHVRVAVKNVLTHIYLLTVFARCAVLNAKQVYILMKETVKDTILLK